MLQLRTSTITSTITTNTGTTTAQQSYITTLPLHSLTHHQTPTTILPTFHYYHQPYHLHSFTTLTSTTLPSDVQPSRTDLLVMLEARLTWKRLCTNCIKKRCLRWLWGVVESWCGRVGVRGSYWGERLNFCSGGKKMSTTIIISITTMNHHHR